MDWNSPLIGFRWAGVKRGPLTRPRRGIKPAKVTLLRLDFGEFGGLARNRTGVQGFAVLCVATPPRGL